MNEDKKSVIDQFTDALEARELDRARQLVDDHPELVEGSIEGSIEGNVSLLMFSFYCQAPEVAHHIRAQRKRVTLPESVALAEVAAVVGALHQDPRRIDERSPDGFALIHLAAFFGHRSVLSVLIAHGADVEIRADNPARQAPIHSAAASRNARIVYQLVAAGADPDAQQHGGFTALHAAAIHGNATMMRVLLGAGAEPGIRSDEGKNAAEMLPQDLPEGVRIRCLALLEG